MGNLIAEALSMGWMALAILAGLLVYFQMSISDPAAKKRAVFKTFIGIVATLLLFMAIANYKNNFYGENRLVAGVTGDDHRDDLRHGAVLHQS